MMDQLLGSFGHAVRTLDCSCSLSLNGVCLRILLVQCPNLTQLTISQCLNVSSEAFEGLAEYDACRQLQTINFKNCSIDDSGILALTKCWMKAGESELVDSPTSVGVIAVSDSDLKRRSWMKPDPNACAPVILFSYVKRHSLSKVAGIRSLNLSGCSQLTDMCLVYLKQVLPALQKLNNLDLSGCYNFTGQALKDFVKVCPNLQAKNLSYCDHIKDGPYVDEANGCQNLQQHGCCVAEGI